MVVCPCSSTPAFSERLKLIPSYAELSRLSHDLPDPLQVEVISRPRLSVERRYDVINVVKSRETWGGR
ncbi:hypothetical protein RRG08_032682 [Elysia crispata]|uniref:Uncharacterized protein n=1 Tax=Elysia crispata TaxID=231223 RepID=A0AAE1CQB6_9GAST|nr:hypothetical protein RRG08_032682 [Elysia crispata]